LIGLRLARLFTLQIGEIRQDFLQGRGRSLISFSGFG
jgi:hypothetical protein